MTTGSWVRRIVWVFLLLSWIFTSGLLRAEGPSVLLVQATGPLTPSMLSYTQRAIAQATADGAPAVILELNTPGGEIDLMQSMVQAIRTSRVPVIIYIAPRGAMAASAGTLVTLAGHLAAMAPETSIGAASPVGTNGQELDPTLARKTKNIIEASARDLASRRGDKAISLAVAAIEDAKAVNAQEALDAGLIDFIADDVPSVLKQADGRTVQIQGGGQVTLHTTGLPVTDFSMTWLEELGQFVANSGVISILFLIGAQAILIELSNPGGWLPGAVGVVSLALAFYGLGTLPVNWFGLVLIGLAFLLFILDVKAPTHGALTAAGLAALIAGFLVLFNSPGIPAYANVSVPLIIGLALMTGAFFAFVVSRAVQAQHRPATTGLGALIGKRAQARTRLDPGGIVFVHGERWSAVTEGEPVEEGESVHIVGVRGLQLLVRPEKVKVPAVSPPPPENGNGVTVERIGE